MIGDRQCVVYSVHVSAGLTVVVPWVGSTEAWRTVTRVGPDARGKIDWPVQVRLSVFTVNSKSDRANRGGLTENRS